VQEQSSAREDADAGGDICARGIDFSTLAHRVGRAAFMLRAVHECLLGVLKGSAKLFADETAGARSGPWRTKIG
jgi:hypothetical protein